MNLLIFQLEFYTVGKQSLWYLSFVYTLQESLPVRIAPNFEKNIWVISVIRLVFNIYTIICNIKAPLFSIYYFQLALPDCWEHSWNHCIANDSTSVLNKIVTKDLRLIERNGC